LYLKFNSESRTHQSMDARYKPVSVDVSNSDQLFTIVWADGHKTELPLFGLRKNCPCVTCRGGHSQMGKYEPELFKIDPPRRYDIVRAESVGNHALKITWDDGHNSGMYKWELFREMDEAVRRLDNEEE